MDPTASSKTEPKRLVLFDGECSFCNASVLFIVDRDPKERFVFAQLQSNLGQATLKRHGSRAGIDSIVLIERNGVYTRSSAVLRIAKGLKWPWPLVFYLFIGLPPRLRDAAYRYFGRHRYQWFGRTDQCRVPTPALRRRMVT